MEVTRSKEDLAHELGELRDSNRKLWGQVEALKGQIEDWRADAVRRDEENKRLRAALAAAHDLLSVYL